MDHLQRLEALFQNAPCNQHLNIVYSAREGEGEVVLHVTPDLLHGGGVVHGAYLFKVLDDAATIAGMSLLPDDATLTSSFTLYFLRPIDKGTITAIGRVIRKGRRQIISEAVAHDENGRELARGSGIFIPLRGSRP